MHDQNEKFSKEIDTIKKKKTNGNSRAKENND